MCLKRKRKEFAKKYPAAQFIKWVSEAANEWEAGFKMGGKEMTASFDNSGKWLETEIEITNKDLPSAVLSALNKDFGDFKTDEISILESPEIKGFEVGLKKGDTSLEVVFDANGNVLKNTNVSEEENKEKKEK